MLREADSTCDYNLCLSLKFINYNQFVVQMRHTQLGLFGLVLVGLASAEPKNCRCSSGVESIKYWSHVDSYKRDQFYYGKFDDDFLWGAATRKF